MKTTKLIIAATFLAASSFAVAQTSKSNVNVDSVVQGGGAGGLGSKNIQNMEIGNAKSGGQSNVRANSIVQGGGAGGMGSSNNQTMKIGNAK